MSDQGAKNLPRSVNPRWDQGRFQLERQCTCRRGDRSAECLGGAGFHVVDTADDALSMLADAQTLGKETGRAYRVRDRATGELVG